MINQEFKALGRRCQVLLNFGICCRELVGSKLRVFGHACAVSALSVEIMIAFTKQGFTSVLPLTVRLTLQF